MGRAGGRGNGVGNENETTSEPDLLQCLGSKNRKIELTEKKQNMAK
jgi:hypothetical protein